MTWKKDFFQHVSIDEDFKVSVINNRNIEVLDRLSAGERLCLAFAFSLTLSKEAGLNFPIVVDTPMGRLSPQVQVNLANVLAESTLGSDGQSNHQIIMLMTETEYNSKVEQALDKRKPKVMEISLNISTGETRVE
jgi:DNA sulfur modification protein DndD